MTENKLEEIDKKTEYLLMDLQELQFRVNKGAEHFIPEMIKIIKEFKVLMQI